MGGGRWLPPPRMTQAPWAPGSKATPTSPDDLVPNPRNWRTHPAEQQRAVAGALAEVGWVAEVLVNRTTGHVVDGHLRIELALARASRPSRSPTSSSPRTRSALVLATLDRLAAMADAEATALAVSWPGSARRRGAAGAPR